MNKKITLFLVFCFLLILLTACAKRILHEDKEVITTHNNYVSTSIQTSIPTSTEKITEETVSSTTQQLTTTVTIKMKKHFTIVALGDSLTEGLGVNKKDSYPSQLEEILIDLGYDVEVINMGVSNEKSSETLNRIDDVIKFRPDIVILTIGANDARELIEPASVKQNIKSMVSSLKAANSSVIIGGMQILQELNISDAVQFVIERFGVSKEMAEEIIKGMNYVDNFRNIYPEIAEEEKVSLIPFFLDGVAGVKELNIADGLHPNENGYKMIVEKNILPVLEPILDNN